MKKFEDEFTDDYIIRYICKTRVKISKQRNKTHLLHLLTHNEEYNYHSNKKTPDFQKELIQKLNSMLPPRKWWKKISYDSRNPIIEGKAKKLSTTDKNLKSLIITVNFYRKKYPNEPFVVELNNYIKYIQDLLQDVNLKISEPYILPQAKDKKELKKKISNKIVCRPISIFPLDYKIILSFTNRYLTNLFDRYFDDCSLAFRSQADKTVNHHTAVENIIEYKTVINPNSDLWVAECDMQKFYDSVDHKIIRQEFDLLIQKARQDFPNINFDCCKRIFYAYLNCYCFNVNALPNNNNLQFWIDRKFLCEGSFGWIEKEIKQYNFYEDISLERIGVPQGGALSGLIANIFLNPIDKVLLSNYNDIFYNRFCDDMIIMHPDKTACEQAINLYKKKLVEYKLAPHDFSSKLIAKRNKVTKFLASETTKPFWKEKSKGPYKWSKFSEDSFPWIGFVGYEINYQGHVRVRKSSLIKEINKQNETVQQIEKAIKHLRRVNGGTVTESAINRLIGMSVSRVRLWNYEIIKSEMCWKTGFQGLNQNKESVRQIKSLDRNRNKLYYNLKKVCDELDIVKHREDDEDEENLDNRQLMGYDKPFSYYYHIIEKKDN